MQNLHPITGKRHGHSPAQSTLMEHSTPSWSTVGGIIARGENGAMQNHNGCQRFCMHSRGKGILFCPFSWEMPASTMPATEAGLPDSANCVTFTVIAYTLVEDHTQKMHRLHTCCQSTQDMGRRDIPRSLRGSELNLATLNRIRLRAKQGVRTGLAW